MTIDRLNDELKRIERSLTCEYNPIKGVYEVFGIDLKKIRYVLYSVPLGQLESASIQILEEVRKAKFFTAKEKIRMLDERDEQDDKANENKLEDEMDHAAAESYDVFQRLEGMRVTLPESGYFEIRDKRRVSPEQVSS